jgi:hypothetical protein
MTTSLNNTPTSTASTSTATNFFDRAVTITERGFSTIPLNGKIPLTPQGAKDRQRDLFALSQWGEQFPTANAAIVADDEYVILESDNEARLTEWLAKLGVKIPRTFKQGARDNRPHWVFKRPAFDTSRNPTIHGVFEFKGHNTYIVGFGSIHPDTGQEYRILEDCPPVEFPRELWDALKEIRAAGDGEKTRASSFVPLTVVGEMRAAVKAAPYDGYWDIFLDSEEARSMFRIPPTERHFALVGLAAHFRNLADDTPENRRERLTKVRDYFCEGGGGGIREITDQEIENVAKHFDEKESAGERPWARVTFGNEEKMGTLPVMEMPQVTEVKWESRYKAVIDPNNYIDLLAQEITRGTSLPFNFARETYKMMLLAGRRRLPQVPGTEYVHSRQYVILLSDEPGVGKGETWRRCQATLQKADFPRGYQYRWVDGGTLGSPEYSVLVFGGKKQKAGEELPTVLSVGGGLIVELTNPRHVVYYDEGKRLAQKDKNAGSSGLITLYTSLFDRNQASMGSFKNGTAMVLDANVSLMLHFTRDAFDLTFAGSGVTSDGFLSRCTFVTDYRNPVEGDWRVVDSAVVRELMEGVQTCMERTSLTSTPQADALRRQFLSTIRKWEPKFRSRLEFLFAQDILARATFSRVGVITEEVVRAAQSWVKHQYETRQHVYPLDLSPDKREQMSVLMVNALQKHGPMTKAKLKDACHVYRVGSGGITVFDHVFRAMNLEPVAKTKKGTPVYGLPAE